MLLGFFRIAERGSKGGLQTFAVLAVHLFGCGKADIALGLRMRTQAFPAINTSSTKVVPP